MKDNVMISFIQVSVLRSLICYCFFALLIFQINPSPVWAGVDENVENYVVNGQFTKKVKDKIENWLVVNSGQNVKPVMIENRNALEVQVCKDAGSNFGAILQYVEVKRIRVIAYQRM